MKIESTLEPYSCGPIASEETITPEEAMEDIALHPLSLYVIKIRAISEGGTYKWRESQVSLLLGYRNRADFIELRSVPIALPVVSDGDDSYGQRGKWYEQTIFVATDDVINALRWNETRPNPGTSLVVRVEKVFVDKDSSEALLQILATMAVRTCDMIGRTYKPFLGLSEAEAFIQQHAVDLHVERLPVLTGDSVVRSSSQPIIGVVGDEMLTGMLGSTYRTLKIGPESLEPAELGLLDLIVVQERAVGIAPRSASLPEERVFISDLARTLAKTPTPVVELGNDLSGGGSGVNLRGLRNCPLSTEISGREYELCDAPPIKGKDWSSSSIAIPCASDLYQYQDFQALSGKLVENGYSLAVSESNFDHVPPRTWERFLSNKVKVYGRLTMAETAELFRNVGFVLLPGTSLRPIADIENLAVLALKSGALPIVVGRRLAAPLDRVIETVYGYADLRDFLAQNNSLLARERLWLSRFRHLQRILDNAPLASSFAELVCRQPKLRTRSRLPAAEMICISKRPENFPRILENLHRQSYSNLCMHLIWNVAPKDAQYCVNISRGAAKNLRVTVMDETRNIGSCLNFGIRESDADYWFKVDDDDYYGAHYVEDGINFYRSSGALAMGKPFGFVYFSSTQEVYLRSRAGGSPVHEILRSYPRKPFVCGATLSAKVDSSVPLFSTEYRNSCDSKWMEAVRERGIMVLCSDLFNFVTYRGDASAHTWQISEDQLKGHAELLSNKDLGGWYDAA